MRRRVLWNMKRWFALCLLTLACMAYLLWAGDRSWVVGVQAATLLFVAATVLMVWRAHFRNTIGRFREMKSPTAEFGLDEKDMMIVSDLGSGTVPWDKIKERWELPDCWLLFLADNQFFTVPTSGVPPEALDYLRERTRHSGAAERSFR